MLFMGVGIWNGSGLLLLLLLLLLALSLVELLLSILGALLLVELLLPFPSFSFLTASSCTGPTNGLACQDRKQYHAVPAPSTINTNTKESSPRGRSNCS